jgi:D-sedoheptulose 7-phosphate isomerase
MMQVEITRQLDDHIHVMQLVRDALPGSVAECAEIISSVLDGGRKMLIMGNGGSAADAQHFAAELVGRFMMERKALPAIALTTDTSILTAIGNDYGFENIFARQVEALGKSGDVVLGISTSGHSANVLNALHQANQAGLKTIGLLGRDGGEIKHLVDLDITVPSMQTPRIQEAHLTIIHLLCDLVEKRLFGKAVY